VLVRGRHRDGGLDPRRRAVAGVGALVAGCGHEGHTRLDGTFDGGVESLVGRAAEAHVGHGRTLGVLGDPVDTGDDALGRARAVGVEHAHRNDARALGDAVLATRDRAGHVGAVTLLVVTVATAVDEVLAGLHAVAEVLVGGVDTGVDDVRGDVVG